LVRLAGDVNLFYRKFALVDEAHAGVSPFECLNHGDFRISSI
jgi:hypothetical protein